MAARRGSAQAPGGPATATEGVPTSSAAVQRWSPKDCAQLPLGSCRACAGGAKRRLPITPPYSGPPLKKGPP